eukprot:8060410-Pyramimonas_sp.AAC.1
MSVLSTLLELWASHRTLEHTNRCKMICCIPLRALDCHWMAESRVNVEHLDLHSRVEDCISILTEGAGQLGSSDSLR